MKQLCKTAVFTLLGVLPLQGDLLRIQGGGGSWHADPSGSLRYEQYSWLSAADQLGYDSRYMPYLWVDLKHPIPYVPNIRLEYTGLRYDGHTAGVITWWGMNAYLTDSAWSEMEVDEYDAMLYYSLLDDTFWLTLDVGLDLKYARARYMIRDDYGVGATYDETGYFLLPQGYLRARAEIPMTDIALEADLEYIESGNSYIYNTRIKADYWLTTSMFGDVGFEAGYRQQRIWINEEDYSTKIDIDAGGFYLGAMLRY